MDNSMVNGHDKENSVKTPKILLQCIDFKVLNADSGQCIDEWESICNNNDKNKF